MVLVRRLLWLLAIPLAALGWWAYHRGNVAPQVPFARVVRETLVSTLPTNGKVEPIEWAAVRAEQAGAVSEVPVREGQTVGQGAPLAVLSDTGLAAGLEAAQARAAQARAEVATIDAGGKQLELTTLATWRVCGWKRNTTRKNTLRCTAWPKNRLPRRWKWMR